MIELLSKRLRDLRIGRGLSQKQVAALIGVDSSTISTYESATRLPSYPALIRLAKVYGVSVDYLLGIEESYTASSLFNSLSRETREVAIEIARVIVKYCGKKSGE